MGLRCQVPDDLESFTVTASWGMYESVPAAGGRRVADPPVQADSGRNPQADHGGRPGESATTEIPLRDKVVLRIDRHDEPEGRCRLIEITLCNDQVAPRKIPVDAWLYQTKLTVTAGESPRSCRSPTRCWTTAGAGRRASPAEAAVPGPAGICGRSHLLGRLGGGRGRSPGKQGVDDVAAGERDAAGHRRGNRCHARHAKLAAAAPDELRTGCHRSWRSTRSGSRRGSAGPAAS